MDFDSMPPEMTAMIAHHMDDESLARYCQSNQYSESICNIPSIRYRIDLYFAFKNFQVNKHLHEIVYRPYLLVFKKETDNQSEYRLEYQFFVLYDDRYQHMPYLAVLDNESSESDGMMMTRLDENHNVITTDDVLEYIESNFGSSQTVLGMIDIKSLYNLYVVHGFEKYAKTTVKQVVDEMFDTIHLHRHHHNYGGELKRLYHIFGLYLWFQFQCHTLALIVDIWDQTIDMDIDEAYANSADGQAFINQQLNGIYRYADLLYRYIDTLL